MPSKLRPMLIDPPASKQLFDAYLNLLREKTMKNRSFSVMQFPGSGIYSHFKYTFRYANILGFSSEQEKKQLFTYVNLRTLIEHPEAFYTDILTYLYQIFIDNLDENAKKQLIELFNIGNISKLQFNQAIYNLTFAGGNASDGYRVAFVVEEFGYLLDVRHSQKCLEFLSSLKRINPMNISYIFMVANEIDETDSFLDLNKEVFDNLVWYRQYMFDDKSADLMFKNNERWNLIQIDNEFKTQVKRVAKGDPFIMHRFIKKYMENKWRINRHMAKKS